METQNSKSGKAEGAAPQYRIERMTPADYDVILKEQELFWGERSDHLFSLHHPMFLYEFGDGAFVARANGDILGYIMGFMAQTGPVGYMHLIAVRKGQRRRGVGTALQAHFERYAINRGARALKAVTLANNQLSVAFLIALGMRPLGLPDPAGTPLVRNYWGSGVDRVVFWKELPV